MRIILASASPRRLELLQRLGLNPEICVPNVDEAKKRSEKTAAFLQRVTRMKLDNIYTEDYSDSLVITADTVVAIHEEIMGKPRDREDAREMLRVLSGNPHEVWTGITLRLQGEVQFDSARTRVYFDQLTNEEIEYYLDHEHYLDKAGAYAIQGIASLFIKKIEGCYFNVMGFPVNLFYKMCGQMSVNLLNIMKKI